jgi:hypothetical protein
MEKDCITYIEGCQICQMGKMVKQKPMRWLHLLEVLKRLMKQALDFFFDLPTGVGGWDGVMIVIDKFSKLFKLVLVKKSMELEGIIRQYMNHVYCNYGLLASIVLDQDS